MCPKEGMNKLLEGETPYKKQRSRGFLSKIASLSSLMVLGKMLETIE
jgi:hypothetical protein